MYLLHITESEDGSLPDIQLRLHVDDIPQYAILSHRWGRPEDEPTFQDLMHQTASGKQKKGFQKILSFCSQVLEYGLTWAWVDTCCIDKSSSAELSEAINSMYAWYEASRICFAYMEDVPPGDDPSRQDSFFRKSVWFKRGWTLQELIAPNEVMFLDTSWNKISFGSKSGLSETIFQVTGIPQDILIKKAKLDSASVAQKMSWAATRQTTRIEDEAYSLMGIFGVNMPTVYGEGKKAFRRLQEEIMKYSPDHTIFAWEAGEDDVIDGMLATSPRLFRLCGQFRNLKYADFVDRFSMRNAHLEPYYFTTNYGLQIQLPIVSMSPHFEGYYFAYLAAVHAVSRTSAVIFLRQRTDRPPGHFSRVRFNGQTLIHRFIPEIEYSDYASVTKVLVSGSEPADPSLSALNIQSMPLYYVTFSMSLTPCGKSSAFLGVSFSIEVQHLSSSDFTTNEASNICRAWFHPTETYPAETYPTKTYTTKTLPITALTRGRHVAVLLKIRARRGRSLLNGITVAVAFGLQGGEPWLFMEPGGSYRDYLPDDGNFRDYSPDDGSIKEYFIDDAGLMAHFTSCELFSTSSVWKDRSKSITFLRRKGLGNSGKRWSFGGEMANGGSWLLSASVKRSITSDGSSEDYGLHVEI